jgi:tetratricopeptide (TPR) repeat protein
VDVDALAVYPHAHYIGKDLQALATLPDGTKKPLVWIKDWDLNWQAVYRYQRPVFLPKGTVISMRFTYDNSSDNPRNPNRPAKRVVAGDKATNEMGHLWLQVLPRAREDQRIVLQEALMRQRLKKYPSDFTAHFNLAAALEFSGKDPGQLQEAISHYRAALRVKPDSAVTQNNLGAALQANGDPGAAITHYSKAVALNPGYANARYNLGNALLSAGKVDEAIIHLRESLRLRPDDAGALNSLGSALATQGKVNEAIAAFAESVRLNPANTDAHINLGFVLASQEKIDEAIAHYEQALRLKPEFVPENAEMMNDLGVLYGRKGRIQEALEMFEKAVRANPDYADARENLKRARAAIKR